MAREFRFPYTEAFEFSVEVDESGHPYAERDRSRRAAWTVPGLLIAGVAGWFVASNGGLDGSLRLVAIPAAVGLLALVGVVSEPILGSGRSRVYEDGDRYYLEMLACTRWYLLAVGVGILMVGTSAFLTVRVPGLLDSVGPGPGSNSVRFAEAVPFGEFVVLVVTVVLAVVAFQKAFAGRLLIVPK